MLRVEAGAGRPRTFGIPHRHDIARLAPDIELALGRPLSFRKLDRVGEVGVVAVPHDGIDALGGRAHRRHLAVPARFRFVFLLAELGVERGLVLEDAPDEGPEALMFLGVGELLAADDDQSIHALAPRLEHNEEAFYVLPSMNVVSVHGRAVEEIDVPALEHGVRVRLHLCHAVESLAADRGAAMHDDSRRCARP